MNDQELVTSILKRDRHALSEFYRTYAPKLRQFIRSKINSPDDAEEVLQDVLYAFLEAIRDFTGSSKLTTFLYAITSHKVIDWYRRKKIRHVVFSAVPQLESLVAPLLGPEEELDASLLREKIRVVLGRLLPMHRSVLILKYADDFTVADIAKKLAISFKSAESQLFRARKAFVELFLSI
ncbi:RNA polymerase sigma factor [Candidatus Gottesmanbacteria bacterium]|nr:RNA polymerase sigma factor [Candidatus Gottesmanbacteria bacterium]